MDALDEPDRLKRLEAHLKKKKLPLLKISGATGEGVEKLLEAMWKAIAANRAAGLEDPLAGGDGSLDPADKNPDDTGVDLLTPARSRRRGA
jgi:hypothetical protein